MFSNRQLIISVKCTIHQYHLRTIHDVHLLLMAETMTSYSKGYLEVDMTDTIDTCCYSPRAQRTQYFHSLVLFHTEYF